MSHRLAEGGHLIDRSRPVTITVDGRDVEAYAGDTLASAMLAADLRRVSTGIYSGRPRGLVGLGAEEPNAFVQVLSGPGEPMVRATELGVHDGLTVESLAGRGRLSPGVDDSRYDHRWLHVEVLVVGGGVAGIEAARDAARTGVRVVLIDEQPALGGWHTGDMTQTMAEQVGELEALSNARVLTRTTAVGLYDHHHAIAVERRTDHLAAPNPDVARRRLWHVTAGEVVVATGSHERPMVFADNDRPGIMLAGAAAEYVRRFGVLPGERAVVWTAHDGGLGAALALAGAGVALAAVLDVRDTVAEPFVDSFEAFGVTVQTGAEVVGTDADMSGSLSTVHARTSSGEVTYDVDLLAVSGGVNPAAHLFSQVGGRLVWSDAVAGFVPGTPPPNAAYPLRVVGAATGDVAQPLTRPATWFVGDVPVEDAARVYLDPQRDATLADLHRAQGAGLTSVEHVKRFTTIGTGADQGRGYGVLTVGVLAEALGRPVTEVGTTTYRPPYTPVSFALLAGRHRGALSDPVRVTAMHDRHVEADLPLEDVGQWKRPWYVPLPGEDIHAAVLRECRAVRTGVGMMDASTLGKIVCHGADVGTFLNRIYTGLFSNLKVGKIRYGVMCGPDGMVIDDGTVARISELEWLMTTTTGNAATVLDTLEEWAMTEWPELDVRFTSVTEQWAVVAVAGPRSREVVAALAPTLDVSNEAFGFMEWRDAEVGGIPARIMRISFSGELAYEIDVPSWWGAALWDAVSAAGKPFDITAYGTETMHVLRAEKGSPIVGQDTDGTVTPGDLGMGWAISPKKVREGIDFIGSRSLVRAEAQRDDRRQLVGLVPVDGGTALAEGAQLVTAGADLTVFPVAMHGHITSAYASAALDGPFALALLDGGRDRMGHELDAVDGLVPVRVRVVAPVPYDPEGERRDG
ncbi:2Fe-2S iron-sulfur cluster-binding protein [Aeromicrobium sp.]|uniref:2Fe-2S iron-sulfur cluster-binding protein n=1 Tax=Aeromicrobium sp. TaxID=1871063 RepID=UPI00198B1C39|nr:2Fe-2S iron-sulfur cluster-binding protein [Aeromicrobium sp.]MBC7631184.1 (2Fe-2S)-binding protein [Aeromicrobium sp.]